MDFSSDDTFLALDGLPRMDGIKMFGRRAAYQRGYIDALETLKADLFAEAKQRIDDRRPFDVGTLSESVMDTINRLIHNQRSLF